MQRQCFPAGIRSSTSDATIWSCVGWWPALKFDEQQIDFLLNRCQVVCFVLQDISEAFQFFDSQNAGGAIWLPTICSRHFTCASLPTMRPTSRPRPSPIGERLPSDELANLFALYLYRVRQWAEGKSARYFGKGRWISSRGVNLDRVGGTSFTWSRCASPTTLSMSTTASTSARLTASA